jgi:pimeloyl-ACP methyl ester carboxylesterase
VTPTVDWTGSDVVVNGVSLHVRRGGNPDGPTVVCAHGFSDDGTCWSRLADRIGARNDVVAVDARNHGRSDRGPADWDVLAADLTGVIDQLGLDRPTLLGHSLGATTVALVAARRPDLVGRIVLEDPPWRLEQAPLGTGELASVRAWVASLGGKSVDELREMGRQQHPNWPDEEFESWAPAKLGLGERSVEHLVPIDWRAVVSRIEAPILLVLGDVERGAIASPEVSDAVSALHDEVVVAMIDGAGHNVRRERFDAYVDALVRFLP